MANSVTASAYGNSCTLTVEGVTVTRADGSTILVSVAWSTTGSATKGQAEINGTRVHDSTASSVPHSQADSGTFTFAVSDGDRKQHSRSFPIKAYARYGSSGAWEWAGAGDTCGYTVPSSAPELFVRIGGPVREAEAVYVNASGGIAEAEAVYRNVAGVIVEA